MNNIDFQIEILTNELTNWITKNFGQKEISQYKNFALGLIFYKFLSNQFEQYAKNELDDEAEYTDLEDESYSELLTELKEDARTTLGYFIAPQNLIQKF